VIRVNNQRASHRIEPIFVLDEHRAEVPSKVSAHNSAKESQHRCGDRRNRWKLAYGHRVF
jgi:hypothetical protein